MDLCKTISYERSNQFSVKGKLSPIYVGPYEVLEIVGANEYHLEVPTKFHRIHNVFHVSSLKRSFGDQMPAVIDLESILLQSNLTYEERPIQIIDWKEKELRNRKIPLVKVLWLNHNVHEAAWKKEVDMRAKYPHMLGS